MRYLITGGAGFIGSHLAEYLSARGDTVVLLDDLSTGSTQNVAHLLDARRAGVELVVGSVMDASLVRRRVADVDAVFHLAACVGMRRVLSDPESAYSINVEGTASVLAAAAAHGAPTLVASSSEVYGPATQFPLREDQHLEIEKRAGPRWAYARAKAVSEDLTLILNASGEASTVVARLFNCVGARQSDAYGMVMPTLVRQALRGQPLTVHGDGQQRRCFSHVADVVGALVSLMDHEGTAGQVFNVGVIEETSILQLAHVVLDNVESISTIEFVSHEEVYGWAFEDVKRRLPNIERIRAATGWEPTRTLHECVADVVAYEQTSEQLSLTPRARSWV